MSQILPFRQTRGGCRILIAAPDGRTRDMLAAEATIAGHEVEVCPDLTSAAQHLSQRACDVCLVDLDDAAGDLDLFCRSSSTWLKPAALLGLGTPERLVAAGVDPSGCFEFLPKPCTAERLSGRLNNVLLQLKLSDDVERLKGRTRRRLADEFVGRSEAADLLRTELLDAAEHDAPLSIVGERGSGTSLAARTVHLFSDRAEEPFIAVDCSLQSSTALEQDLLGTDDTGAIVHYGRLKQAAGGTLLLEKLETVPLPAQRLLAKLIGPHAAQQTPQHESVRFVAILHTSPDRLIEQGQLDAGLAELLGAETVLVPALSERREDIVPIAEHFLTRLAVEEGQPLRRLSYDAKQLLTAHDWAGNVAQLWNVLQRTVAVEETGTLATESLKPWIDDTAESTWGMTLREMERKLIETTFNRCRGNREQTAQTLRIGLRTLSGKLRDYGYPPRGGPGSNVKIAQRKAA